MDLGLDLGSGSGVGPNGLDLAGSGVLIWGRGLDLLDLGSDQINVLNSLDISLK